MRRTLVVLVAAGVLAAAAAIGVAQQGGGSSTSLKATDQQVTINHRIAVAAMSRANQVANGPASQVQPLGTTSLGSGEQTLATFDTDAGQSYLVAGWIMVQGTTPQDGGILCYAADAQGNRPIIAQEPLNGVRSVTLSGVFTTPSQGIAIVCDGYGVNDGYVQTGSVSITEVTVQG